MKLEVKTPCAYRISSEILTVHITMDSTLKLFEQLGAVFLLNLDDRIRTRKLPDKLPQPI